MRRYWFLITLSLLTVGLLIYKMAAS